MVSYFANAMDKIEPPTANLSHILSSNIEPACLIQLRHQEVSAATGTTNNLLKVHELPLTEQEQTT